MIFLFEILSAFAEKPQYDRIRVSEPLPIPLFCLPAYCSLTGKYVFLVAGKTG